MIKESLKKCAGKFGVYLASTERFGIELELDLHRLTALDPIRTIFDVGANFGQTACRFASAFPHADILSFEPVPDSFGRLVEATRDNHRVTRFNLALGDVPGMVQMNLTNSPGSNSIVQVGSASKVIDVQVETVDRIADQSSIVMIDLLKIDVEGYELPVLTGASRFLSEGRIRFIYAECVLSPNPEMPHTSFFDLYRVLDQAGFCLVTYYAESFNLRLGCSLGNALFALRSKLPSEAPGRVANIF
jgi:FkbM family methyltransferase